MLPNGNVLLGAGVGETRPTYFYEFTLAANYGGGSFVSVPAPGNSNSVNVETYNTQLLLLPTGQVMFTDGSTDVEIYTPSSQNYPDSWRPYQYACGYHLDCIALTIIHNTQTNTIAGENFNGMSQATMFGNNAQMATNYPLLRITGFPMGQQQPKVYYCRTHDHSSMGVATGYLGVSTQFDCPNIPTGFSGFLEIVANGIPSVRNFIATTVP